MVPIQKFGLGLGIASGALFTAWLLTGGRKQKTKKLIVKNAEAIRKVLKTPKELCDDQDVHFYI